MGDDMAIVWMMFYNNMRKTETEVSSRLARVL